MSSTVDIPRPRCLTEGGGRCSRASTLGGPSRDATVSGMGHLCGGPTRPSGIRRSIQAPVAGDPGATGGARGSLRVPLDRRSGWRGERADPRQRYRFMRANRAALLLAAMCRCWDSRPTKIGCVAAPRRGAADPCGAAGPRHAGKPQAGGAPDEGAKPARNFAVRRSRRRKRRRGSPAPTPRVPIPLV